MYAVSAGMGPNVQISSRRTVVSVRIVVLGVDPPNREAVGRRRVVAQRLELLCWHVSGVLAVMLLVLLLLLLLAIAVALVVGGGGDGSDGGSGDSGGSGGVYLRHPLNECFG